MRCAGRPDISTIDARTDSRSALTVSSSVDMVMESVGDVKKLVEHLLTTFKNFHVETLSDMWWTKTRVLKAIVACGGGNDYVIPRSNTD
jgi:hypothetical protein